MPFEITYPNIDPAFSLGPVTIHWYGVMYLLAFLVGWLLGNQRAKRPQSGWTSDDVTDLIIFAAVGAILGGRVGYVLFYGLSSFLADPLSIFRLSDGGMSFHGGLLGVLAAILLFGRRKGRNFWDVTDFIAPLVPLGLFFGRMGNFINGELWGAPTSLPWGMVFPTGGPEPRHPSMLYEALLEGIVLFVLLWVYSGKPRPRMAVSGWFLIGYGTFRTLIEFVREPDAHLGYLAFGWVTMGMVLTFPMVIFGVWLVRAAHRNPKFPEVKGLEGHEDSAPSADERSPGESAAL